MRQNINNLCSREEETLYVAKTELASLGWHSYIYLERSICKVRPWLTLGSQVSPPFCSRPVCILCLINRFSSGTSEFGDIPGRGCLCDQPPPQKILGLEPLRDFLGRQHFICVGTTHCSELNVFYVTLLKAGLWKLVSGFLWTLPHDLSSADFSL